MSRHVQPPPGPLCRRFEVSSVKDGGTAMRIEASAPERLALAHQCDLPGIDALDADLLVRREGSDGLRVTGNVKARVRRICVVSLDEFSADLDEPVDVGFAPEAEVAAMAVAWGGGQDHEDQGDLPDPIVGGRVDLGALAAEILVLGLDPYPKKPGIAFAESALPSPEMSEASPFAVLRGSKAPTQN